MLPPALSRLVASYVRVLRPAVLGAATAALVAALVLGANVARSGTFQTRAVAVLLIAAAVVAVVVRYALQRRWTSSEDRALKSVVVSTQPELGRRIVRALRLSRRDERLTAGESRELAQLYYERMLSRASELAVTTTARERARRFGRFAVIAFAAAAGGMLIAPLRLLEGLNVMLATNGVAPVEMRWLSSSEVEANPPSYLRQPRSWLSLESASMMPEGTELVVRAEPLFEGRQLVLTDGISEQPFMDDGKGSLVARFELTASAKLRVAARFGDVLIYEPRGIDVFSLPDQPPRVELLGAPREIRLDEMQRLELSWTAEDDHSITEVELLIRSAGKEDRRNLERLPGDKRSASGGYVLYPDDPFLQRLFLPATIRVHARDNDPRMGSKWGQSEAITIRPPHVGEPQTLRYKALLSVRDRVTDLLALVEHHKRRNAASPSREEQAAFAKELESRLSELRQHADKVLRESYSGLTVPRGWSNFARAQLEQLKPLPRAKEPSRVLENVVLGLDSAMQSLSTREAQEVSKELANVADEAAVSARVAQGEKNRAQGIERLDLAISVLELGAKELSELGVLGADIGSVALADLDRVQRSRLTNDFFHAELAALHLAARLRRPNASFGSKGGGGGGVEAGPGTSGGSGAEPEGDLSEAESEFDRLARELEQLSQEHAEALDQTSNAMRNAEQQLGSEGLREEAKRRAEALRQSSLRLPQPGEEPGTGRASSALAREHTGAMAHELERLAFDEALESGRRALNAAEEALRRGNLHPYLERELSGTMAQLREQIRWAQEQNQRRDQLTEEAAKEALERVAELESELAERARRLSQEEGARETLNDENVDRLSQAGRLMENAANRLGMGEGKEGLRMQREAQRLLEESKPGTTDEQQAENGRRSEGPQHGGRKPGVGGDVPDPDARNGAQDFRQRVLEGLKKSKGGRLSPAVQRYAEGLLQ